ncbi:AAA family ATPase [Paenibacillus sanguinis]|uniref:AAA family ATPase n=1 Tax=Paenibacillus sanguinis TaxID=225906 RepID=UPI00037153A8|nr:ATP-binding protein [Paenibacillus sanguinis]
MLIRFEVEGFKNFSQRVALDFTDVRDYKFNTSCVKDGILNKLIVYGKNAVGKTNLGLAIFDIASHLSDNNVTPGVYNFYLNADSDTNYAEFRYVFNFNQSKVAYCYRKSDFRELMYETVSIDDKLVFSYDFQTKQGDFSGLQNYAPSLNFEFHQNNLSVLRYIVSNSKTEDVPELSSLVKFVSRMLWFRSLDENRYIGYKTDSSDYINFIFEGNYVKEFEEFLNKSGVSGSLISKENPSGDRVLYFNHKKPLPFLKTASNGTKALYTIFYWLKTTHELSLLFIDEFDAYYHVELSEAIVQMLQQAQNFQTILTSHNTNLLSNKIMRPDCYFILTPDMLVSFANATKRELREGHNLEKLYISGEFDE